jgi:hypothetical protein
MCSTAIFWAGCPKVIYGCPAPARGALATMPEYRESESPFCGNYGACSAPAEKGGRGVDVWRICDGIPNTAGVPAPGTIITCGNVSTRNYREDSDQIAQFTHDSGSSYDACCSEQVVREVIGPLLPEEGMDTHYHKQFWGIAKPGPDVECKWGAPVAAMATGAFNRKR